jgi:succinoglycan biosynthesis protein ExoA
VADGAWAPTEWGSVVMSVGSDRTFVSIIMPAFNEERYVARAIDSLIPDGNVLEYEILVIDGRSTDRTRDVVQKLANANPRIRLVINEKRVQSAALNVGAQAASPAARIILRADCHATYSEGFVERCVARLTAAEAVSVVVPMQTVGMTCFQRAVAAAQNSILGNGGSAHRRRGKSRFVDHGHHAAFDREFFLSMGGYDERFTHNEDAELDVRIGRAGGRIWLETSAVVTYFPRPSVRALARQYFRHGLGRAKTFWKHLPPLKLRQFTPLLILYACVGAGLLAVAEPRFLAIPVAYAGLCVGWGFAMAVRRRDRCLAASGIAAITMHLAWAAGFTVGTVKEFFHRDQPSDIEPTIEKDRATA